LLQLRASTVSELQGPLNAIVIAARRAAGLTQHLLAFSRQQALQPEVINLNEVIANGEPALRRILGGSIALELVLAEQLPAIRIDRSSLEQVVQHLAGNAREAMPDGGLLRLETAHLPLSVDRPDARVRLSVIDTGPGMDAATQRRLFEPFFTTKAVGQGTGLGLAMVYGTLQQSGGSIQVQSQVGAGTRFDLDFPCVTSAK